MTTCSIMACLRFLVHELTFNAAHDTVITLKPDIFEEVITRPSQTEQPSVDIIGEWLKQPPSHLPIPPNTRSNSPIDAPSDAILSRFARHIPIEIEAYRREAQQSVVLTSATEDTVS